jgi:hypothetical protein
VFIEAAYMWIGKQTLLNKIAEAARAALQKWTTESWDSERLRDGGITSASNLLPVGLAFIVTSVANGLLNASWKARLVFLRWQHALPGHRAFGKYALADPRIDVDQLKRLLGNGWPEGPEAENRAWYRIFKEVEAAPEVQHTHREYLIMRDYTGLSALFVIGLGAAAIGLVHSWRITAVCCLVLVLQFLVVRHAAATYGERFVCTVLAVKSVETEKAAQPRKHRQELSVT